MARLTHFEIDGWRIDTAARTAVRAGTSANLSPRAIRLLSVLAEKPGATLSRSELLDRVWPNVFVSDESLTQVVSEIRRTLGDRDLIATIARGGYRLTAPVSVSGSPITDDAPDPTRGLTLDAYALCIEARNCFAAAPEGVHRTFLDLAAEAAARAPGFAEARALHATALIKRHIYLSEGAMLLEATIEEAEAAIALDPQLATAHLMRGAALITIGEIEPGVRSVERALFLGQDDAALHLDAAILLLTMGQRRSAAALASKSAKLSPKQFGADLLLARILMLRDPQRARSHCELALRKVRQTLTVDPGSMRALYALGPLLAQLGDHRGARAALEGVSHHDSALEYYRAVGFALLGDTSSALERLDFLAMRGWRHACVLDHDDGFASMLENRRFQKLQDELSAA